MLLLILEILLKATLDIAVRKPIKKQVGSHLLIFITSHISLRSLNLTKAQHRQLKITLQLPSKWHPAPPE